MAIKRSFKGASIRKPGAYSFSTVDNSGGAPLAANGTLFILGEADTGAPGSSDGIQRYSAAQMSELIAKYSSGPLVDVARSATQPSKTPGVQGADEILIWKTNASTQASLILQTSAPANIITLKDKKWGLPGNYLTAQVSNGTAPSLQKQITIRDKKNQVSEVLDENPAVSQLSLQYVGAGSAASATITGASENAKNLVITVTGAADSVTIALKDYTMKDLVDYLNAFGGGGKYSATLDNTQTGTVLKGTELDPISAVDVKTASVSLYRLQNELVEIINENSQLVSAEKAAIVAGIPAVLAETFLSGGAKGASASSDFATGLSKSLSVDYGVALPAISRDAADDIAADATDSGSTYDIESVHTALDSHLRLRGTIKNRKEAQGMVGYRKAAKADVYAQAQALSSELVQLWMQDVLVLDTDANLRWKQPHVGAAMLAGIRLGTEVGEPATHKFLNCVGVGHAVNSETGLPAGDFDPSIDYDLAIDAGVTFAEQVAGGFRVVVDNTTYGKDQSFVYNRGSVVEAAQYVAKTLRETAELVFVGQKVSNGIAVSIKSVLTSKLIELNQANIITQSSDAPNGFVEETFTVQVEGNTAIVKVEVKPVQGLDFVLIEFTLGDIRQSA